ncbi:hypothetical protein NQ318_016035, partial [Aromia moschata]
KVERCGIRFPNPNSEVAPLCVGGGSRRPRAAGRAAGGGDGGIYSHFRDTDTNQNINGLNSTGEPVYRKVAVVENFFDIIYNVHVDLEGRPGKHAGQKRTYRTITETYAFLPREAVTRFLLGCTECQKHPRSPSPASLLPTPSPSPTLPTPSPAAPPAAQPPPPPPPPPPKATCPSPAAVATDRLAPSPEGKASPKPPEPSRRSSNPLDVANLTARDPPRYPAKKRHLEHPPETAPKLWSPVDGVDEPHRKRMLMGGGDIDYSLPITTTYLKYMRTLGCGDEEALKLDSKHVFDVLNPNLTTELLWRLRFSRYSNLKV